VGRPALLVDAGPLYAYVDEEDRHHARSRELLETYPGPLLVPVLVAGEVAFLVGRWLGPTEEVRFLGDLAGATFLIEPVREADWTRMAQLVARYRDLPLGTVDASVIAAAERLGIGTVATLDRRHFSVVRPAHVEAFELRP
jgi:predicted nucleic acid-binding protein